MSNAVQKMEHEEVALPQVMTPLDVVAHAVARGAPIDQLTKLMELQERYEANQARKAFDEAMAAAKAEMPVIMKNRTVDFTSSKGRTHYRHEDLAEIARVVNPILGRHGLSYRFRTTSVIGEPVSVTCIITHRLGHYEENTMWAARDDSGNKNSIQAVGSTSTYLQRMTLKASLGLAASDDDDGAKADEVEVERISEEQEIQLRELNESVGANEGQLCAYLGVARLRDLPARRYDEVVRIIKTFDGGR